MRTLLFSLALIAGLGRLAGQDVMMQGWYWDYPKATGAGAWSANLTAKATALGGAGFTHVWLPPLSRASFGFNSNGYDPKDLYDLGEFGQGPTGFGTRAQVDATVSALNAAGVDAVADVVYNHRDGGAPEVNPAVRDYITVHYDASKQPMPSDRWFCRLPLGGASGNGAGDYYLKVSSKSGAGRFYNAGYRLRTRTSLVTAGPTVSEDEFNGGSYNGGGDCGQGFNVSPLGADFLASLDDNSNACLTDEIKITVTASDFDAAGDYLDVYLTNTSGGYSDHRVYGLWNASAATDVAGQLEYLTYTDFTALPSGQGALNFEAFKPNTATAATTALDGDWDSPIFFYDYDQDAAATKQVLTDWTDWLMTDVGIGGLRMDAVKHFDPAFIGDVLGGLSSAPTMVVGEVFDGNPTVLANWVNAANASAPGAGVRVFDFALRDALKQACDNGAYDVRNVFASGIVDAAGVSGFNSVTFVNNHDFRGPGEPMQADPLLAYAYILTNNQVGLPCVFYPDYFGVGVPNAPTVSIRAELDELIAFQQTDIAGAASRTYLNAFGSGFGGSYIEGAASDALVYQLRDVPTGRDVVVAINFGTATLKLDQVIDNAAGNPTGTRFDDVFGRSAFPFAQVDAAGALYLEVPPRSYAVWQREAAPLPLSWVGLSAKRTTPTRAEVDWRVADERDVARYTVQVSPDGKAFADAAAQPAQGKTEYAAAVTGLDPAERYVARVRSTDRDGSSSYSPIVALERTGQPTTTPSLRLAPNPASGEVALVGLPTSPRGQGGVVRVVNALGQVVDAATVAGGASGEVRFSVSGLPAGAYTVHVEHERGQPQTLRLLVE